jgi:pimeloyl-ACP methyl ester carboxylesterase
VLEATEFTVEFGADAVDDLRARLARIRWPEPETVDDWSQGVPLTYLREVCHYWANDYDFQAAQARLNRFPQFRATVDGLDIHYLHVASPHANATPIVLTHGWPGSFVEFLDVIEPLTTPTDPADAFEVIVPSLPGFGYSGKPTGTGWGVDHIAHAWDELLVGLGHQRYAVQGGDWGAIVSTRLAQLHPEHVFAVHVNMPLVALEVGDEDDLTDEERQCLASMAHQRRWERGYLFEQATRPQTIGYALTDSPVGQCAWVLEKFWAWVDHHGHPEDTLTKDQLLDNISVYWFGANGASSARLYWESSRRMDMSPVETPSGVSIFPREIFTMSKRWCEQRFHDLRYYHRVDRGGHFAAFEQPELFVDELRACFGILR